MPTLNDNGEHVGGISGFLVTLGYAIKLLRPTRVIIVFDGKGGSLRRKKIYPDYKENRSMPVRINRAYEGMVDMDKERTDMITQMMKLIDFLRELPVSIVCIDNIEADDAIAYVATQMYPSAQVTIMSEDKDFIQLVNSRVSLYRPVEKKLYGVQDVINKYGLHPNNYVYFRILDGDKSDNIGKIDGIGLPTVKKIFPMLKEEKESSVAEILEMSKNRYNEKKIFATITDNASIVSRNYELMQLKTPNFTPSLQMQVEKSVENIHTYNKFQLIQKMTEYSMHHSIQNFHVWAQEVFWPLSVLAKS